MRAGVTLGPETTTAFRPLPLSSSRSNPYPASGSNLDIGGAGLPVFNDSNCTGGGINATIPPWASLTPAQQAQYGVNLRYPFTPTEVEEQYNNVIQFGFAGFNQTDNVPAPACIQQPLFDTIGATLPPKQYQQVFREP